MAGKNLFKSFCCPLLEKLLPPALPHLISGNIQKRFNRHKFSGSMSLNVPMSAQGVCVNECSMSAQWVCVFNECTWSMSAYSISAPGQMSACSMGVYGYTYV